MPSGVSFQLVHRIEAIAGNKAFCQTEGHRGVIGPLAGNQTKMPASHHIVDGLEFSGFGEFEGCTEGISHGKAEKAPSIAFP